MPRILWTLAAGGLLIAASPTFAQSPFDGTWKGQVASMKSQSKPQIYSINGMTYRCVTCTPAYSVAADGEFHKVAGMDYWDELSVALPDDRTAVYRFKRGGRVIADSTYSVTADGMTLATISSNINNGAGVPIESKGSATRVGKPAPGAHMLSGSWSYRPSSAVSDAAMIVSIKTVGDKFQLTSPMGETLNATIGGAYALNEGDPGRTMTKVERLSPRVLRMTDQRGGKPVGVTTYTVAADGRTLTGESRNPQTGGTSSFVAIKQ